MVFVSSRDNEADELIGRPKEPNKKVIQPDNLQEAVKDLGKQSPSSRETPVNLQPGPQWTWIGSFIYMDLDKIHIYLLEWHN